MCEFINGCIVELQDSELVMFPGDDSNIRTWINERAIIVRPIDFNPDDYCGLSSILGELE